MSSKSNIVNTIIESGVESEESINYENEKAKELKELADEDVKAAEVLLECAEKTEDEKSKKSIAKKSIQTSMEAIEKYQKVPIYADEKGSKIKKDKKRQELEKTHNNSFLQLETQRANLNVLDKKDIDELNSCVNKKKGEKSLYNAVRYQRQNVGTKEAKIALSKAKKAKNNTEKRIKDSKTEIITANGVNVRIPKL